MKIVLCYGCLAVTSNISQKTEIAELCQVLATFLVRLPKVYWAKHPINHASKLLHTSKFFPYRSHRYGVEGEGLVVLDSKRSTKPG